MTRTERRLFAQTIGLGTLLTLMVATLLLRSTVLTPLERWLYDWRARQFQYFSPPPTTKLVHLDIDDSALDSIGRWPWPRAILAEMTDELRLAGSSAVAFDVMFPEAQTFRSIPGADGEYEIINDDQVLAESLEQFGQALVPIAMGPRGKADRLRMDIVDLLMEDLELSPADVAERLDVESDESAFLAARRHAMYARISDALDAGVTDPEELRQLLLPRTDPTFTGLPQLRLLQSQHQKASAMKTLQPFSVAKPTGLPRLLPVTGDLPPVPVLAEAAAATAFVDYLADEDGVVRSVPLWVAYRGRLYPQMGLALACLLEGIDLNHIQIGAEQVIIPRHDQSPLIIPVHENDSDAHGRFGMVVDVPWSGPHNKWEYIYDWPTYNKASQHLPMSKVWEVRELDRKIRQNNSSADDAMRALLHVLDPGQFAAFEAATFDPLDTDARLPLMEWTLKESAPFLEMLKEVAADDLDEDSRQFLSACTVLKAVREQNPILTGQLTAERERLREILNGRAVLVGAIATAMGDIKPTSIHAACPGVVVHGMVFNAVMTGQFWKRLPISNSAGIAVIIGLMTTMLATSRPSRALVGSSVLAAIYVLINGLLLFDYMDMILSLAGPLLVIVLVWSGCTLQRFVIERRERARITRRFQTYVDPALVRYVIDNPDQARLDGQVRELTVVFTDLAGFTTLSEQLREKSVPLLNEYMGLMVPAIRKYNGYLNKFLGDGIMFFFGAPWDNPRHAVDAVETVLDMHTTLEGFNENLRARNLPTVAMRAGISTGLMVVGDAGGSNASDYTVLGDTVNLGARLESANKATGTRTLITDRTVELIGPDRFLFRPVAKVQVVGKEEAVMTFEPLARISEATDQQRQLVALSAQMLEQFIAERFDDCLRTIETIRELVGEGKLIALYRKLCEKYLSEGTPEDFDGRIELTEK